MYSRKLRIGIVVGGKWHSPELALAMEELGHTVTLIDPNYVASKRALIGLAIKVALKVSGRFKPITAFTYSLYTKLARAYLHELELDLVVAWSGFGLEIIDNIVPVVLVRGSSHIRTQRDALRGVEPTSSLSACALVYREECEYASAQWVTVPTSAIAQDPRWASSCMIVAPYGMPPVSRKFRARRSTNMNVDLVFAGEISKRKGADLLVRFDDVSMVESLIILGSRRGPASFPLPNKAQLFGQVESTKVLEVMSKAHVLVLLSREEGMARVGLEAMSIGLPLLVTRSTGLGVWCEQGAGICLDDEPSVEELDEAVIEIANNWIHYSTCARELAAANTWKKHAEIILNTVRLNAN